MVQCVLLLLHSTGYLCQALVIHPLQWATVCFSPTSDITLDESMTVGTYEERISKKTGCREQWSPVGSCDPEITSFPSLVWLKEGLWLSPLFPLYCSRVTPHVYVFEKMHEKGMFKKWSQFPVGWFNHQQGWHEQEGLHEYRCGPNPPFCRLLYYTGHRPLATVEHAGWLHMGGLIPVGASHPLIPKRASRKTILYQTPKVWYQQSLCGLKWPVVWHWKWVTQ